MWMADADYQSCFVYLPWQVAKVRVPLGVPAGWFDRYVGISRFTTTDGESCEYWKCSVGI